MNNIETIIGNQNVNYEQLSELLIIAANQQVQISEMKQVINMQSQLMNEMNQKFQTIILKLADLEIVTRISDESLQEVVQAIENVSTSLEETKNSIDNIKVYKMVAE